MCNKIKKIYKGPPSQQAITFCPNAGHLSL